MSGYVLSDDADADLQDIFTFGVGAWGEKQATRYLFELYEILNRIGENPQIGPLRDDLLPNMRAFPRRSHTVYFMPWRGSTLIVRVLHGAADHQRAFAGYELPADLPG